MRSEKTKTVSKDERGNKRFGFCIRLTLNFAFFIFSLIYPKNESFSYKIDQGVLEKIFVVFLDY